MSEAQSSAAPLAVITGTTHGIGRICARELARAGYSVLMLCRNAPAAEALRDELRSQFPGVQIDCLPCDLASLASVQHCAAAVSRQFPPIARLINNAGMVSLRHRMSVDGFELTFATNHLGPFLLTALLLGRMASGARIINLASRVHYKGRLALGQIADPEARYSAQQAYAQSKLANVMHTFALARRLAGRDLTVNCLHPGVVNSNLLPRWLRLIKPLLSRVIFDEERGAATTLHLALSAELENVSGQYFDEHQHIQHASALACDSEVQEALWEASVRWCGLRPN
jgi:NAD(P)-dependent dehydrogenase (short-subunit alcohol dehydrogenase family)